MGMNAAKPYDLEKASRCFAASSERMWPMRCGSITALMKEPNITIAVTTSGAT